MFRIGNEIRVGHGGSAALGQLVEQLRQMGMDCRVVTRPADLKEGNLAVVLFDAELLRDTGIEAWRKYAQDTLFIAPRSVSPIADLLLDDDLETQSSLKLIRLACHQWTLKRANRELKEQRALADGNLDKMASIGIALSAERDLGKLLGRVLDEGQHLACCDAASLFLVDRSAERPELVFKLTQNDSIDFPFQESRFPIDDNSIAGYVTNHGGELNIPDVYRITEGSPYRFNFQFDDSTGYRTVSLLAIPMRNHRNEVIGVLQFINRKTRRELRLTAPEIAHTGTQAFDESSARLLRALAGISAVAIQNNVLIASINRLFEGFVHASVAAIEQRDPTTSGHSFRVADLCVGLARELPRSNFTRFRHVVLSDVDVRELRYAALLHDFGKVGVRENVLVKARKLYDWELGQVKQRIELTRERARRAAAERIIHLFEQGQYDAAAREQINQGLQQDLTRLDEFLKAVLISNEPTVLHENSMGFLQEIHRHPYEPLDSSEPKTLLSDEQFRALSIPKGSLSSAERREIESHVTHTVRFLSLIPWTPELRHIPTIAANHHEKLDGSGYPNRLRGDEISLQPRIMTICDIYDALTASDRPYKPAVPKEMAFRILGDEAKRGMLDEQMVRVFIEAEVYRSIEGKDYPRAQREGQPVYHHHVCDFDLHRSVVDEGVLK